ncbi:hypothetical protein [Ruegeria arenilitoris]|uniref:hypothetical protein n=1 Tax=Ruegeria arenilitoris TaxID=1173585 RepID=UPI001480419B|nr:hypothetical protein [Ruegeria arenilitoris]
MNELQDHAHAYIDERPAWPKQIFIVDEVPLTTVGKIYKPTLRTEAVRRAITELIQKAHNLPDADITATDGGARELHVTVTLPEQSGSTVAAVEEALADTSSLRRRRSGKRWRIKKGCRSRHPLS